MDRSTEPELMDEEEQARAYAEADFEQSDSAFVQAFLSRFGGDFAGPVIDLGCGPGNIAVGIARVLPECQLLGIDGSAAMLRHARGRAAAHGVVIRWEQRVLPDPDLPARTYGAIVSNSLLHHLADPQVLWRAVGRIGRVGAPVQIMDLRRPRSPQAAQALLDTYGAGHPEVLRHDFLASLHAAFTPAEVADQVNAAGLPLHVEAVGDRHLRVWGTLAG